jgi:hypothetical protein
VSLSFTRTAIRLLLDRPDVADPTGRLRLEDVPDEDIDSPVPGGARRTAVVILTHVPKLRDPSPAGKQPPDRARTPPVLPGPASLRIGLR